MDKSFLGLQLLLGSELILAHGGVPGTDTDTPSGS
jgi:hypothetical protein